MESECQQVPNIGMDQKHRELIRKNLEKLISKTDYEELKQECIRKKLLSMKMINNIEALRHRNEDEEASKQECHRQLFIKLTKRGPEAFKILTNIFDQLNYEAALKLLKENSEYISISQNKKKLSKPTVHFSTTPLPPTPCAFPSRSFFNEQGKENNQVELKRYTNEICPNQQFQVIKSTKIYDEGKDPVYQMKSKHNRGVLLVVNIIKFVNEEDYRRGADQDSQSLLKLFKEFGFKLYFFQNLKKEEFFHLLQALLETDDVRNTECFLMAFMSHGQTKGKYDFVEFSDGAIEKVDNILNYFSDDRCRNLLRTPKIFLLPFCRGEELDYGPLKTQTDTVGHMKPNFSDTFICYATVSGYAAHRDPETGSWYIQNFCKYMAQYAHDRDLESIVKMIHLKTGEQISEIGTAQRGNYYNIDFNKKLHFNPGCYEPCDGNSDSCFECAYKKN